MKSLLLGILLVLIMGTNALAQGPCRADIEKFCKDVKPGGGRIMRCLKEHKSEVSEACKAKWAAMKQKVAQAKAACQNDASRLCKDIRPGAGRIFRCLKSNENSLTATCKASITPQTH